MRNIVKVCQSTAIVLRLTVSPSSKHIKGMQSIQTEFFSLNENAVYLFRCPFFGYRLLGGRIVSAFGL